MSEQSSLPTAGERETFAQRLGQFRCTLSSKEQCMLDAMAMAAFAPTDQSDVHGYEWFYGGPQYTPSTSSQNPWWYNGSGTAAWNQTVWGTTIGGIQGAYPTGGQSAYPSGGLP